MEDLSIIIPFLNEGGEVEKTLLSIRATTAGNPPVILVNDASDDGFDYEEVARRYGCRYVEHSERRGVAASRDEGAALCETDCFILLDAHMEFYERGWDGEITRALNDNPESILCCRTRVLDADRKPRNTADVFGAYLSLNREDICKAKWNRYDASPGSPLTEISVVLGAAYAARKRYWQHLHGLRGLIHYGMDEELISVKCRMEGGRCLLMKNITAGHVYRKTFPYPVESRKVLHNRIFTASLLFGDTTAGKSILEKLRTKYGAALFDGVLAGMNAGLIREEREYLASIAREDIAYFLYKNTELRN